MRRGEQLLIRVHYFLNWRGILAAGAFTTSLDAYWMDSLALEVDGEVLVDVGQVMLDLATHFAKVLAQVLIVLKLGVLLLLLLHQALQFLVHLALLHAGY